VPKIISKCCELVKLCHINRSSPGFFETLYTGIFMTMTSEVLVLRTQSVSAVFCAAVFF